MINSKRMRWEGQVAGMGKRRGVYRVLVGKPEGKILLHPLLVTRSWKSRAIPLSTLWTTSGL